MVGDLEESFGNQGMIKLESDSNPTLESTHSPASNDDDYGNLDPQTAEVGGWIAGIFMSISIFFFALAACHKLWTCFVKTSQNDDLTTSLLK